MRVTPSAYSAPYLGSSLFVLLGALLSASAGFAAVPLAENYRAATLAEEQGRFADAIAQYTDAIRENPNDAIAHYRRGLAYERIENRDRALEDFNSAIRLNPELAGAYHHRGNIYRRRNVLTSALANYDTALRLMPDASEVLVDRAVAHRRRGSFALSLADLGRAVELEPESAEAHDGLAWLAAVCPDAAFRDGVRAVLHALRACELSDWENPDFISTLAAAHAEAGNFEEAVRFQRQYLESELSGFQRSAARFRLNLYLDGRPYRALFPRGGAGF